MKKSFDARLLAACPVCVAKKGDEEAQGACSMSPHPTLLPQAEAVKDSSRA